MDSLKIPPRIATLPCELLMSGKYVQCAVAVWLKDELANEF